MPRMLAAVAWLLAALLVGLCSPPGAHAAGFLLFEQSGRAMGSAYAGEGAIATDPTTNGVLEPVMSRR